MAKNENLHKAKDAKNDEFYTQLSDIENELRHYKKYFKNKTVYCNCDDPTSSEFWRYFHLNFNELGLKKLVSTHYDTNKPTYKLEYYGENDNDIEVGVMTPLKQNGDFKSDESVELLNEADIVVTNPPFSKFRSYVHQLMEHNKDFLIIGNKNAITYKEFFPLLKENKVWLGYTSPKEFVQPDGSIKKFGNIGWFTNLDIDKRHEELVLWQRYYDDDGNPLPNVEERYPHYDNYPQAINVDKVANIPCDYYGVMGVPITYLDKHNPEQFEICGVINHGSDGEWDLCKAMINGKEKYKRLAVRRKNMKYNIFPKDFEMKSCFNNGHDLTYPFVLNILSTKYKNLVFENDYDLGSEFKNRAYFKCEMLYNLSDDYIKSANILQLNINKSRDGNSVIPFVIPCAFCCRQAVELYMKYIAIKFSLSGNLHTHKIANLWKIINPRNVKELVKLNNFVEELDLIDSDSSALRFALNNKFEEVNERFDFNIDILLANTMYLINVLDDFYINNKECIFNENNQNNNHS